jgi:sirohydrochlorin cobaltochelatase
MKEAILIVGHGSREERANREFRHWVGSYRKRHPGREVFPAFLELAGPSLPEALETMAPGFDVILVLPFFLFAAKHVKRHIPQILRAFRKKHPGVKVRLARPLGCDPRLGVLLDERLKAVSRK